MVVGAGASVESGLPSWRELLVRLLTDVGRQAGAPEDSETGQPGVSAFCDWTLANEGLLGAGAVADAAFGSQLPREVRKHLYAQSGPAPQPGPLTLGVARLKELWGEHCEVVTTNYDDLLERAFVVVGGGKLADISLCAAGRRRERVVRHLHGLVTPRRTGGNLVLSEADYHRMQGGGWQEKFVQERLEVSTCLFVGASMTDPNLLRYLYRAHAERRHVVVLPRQADAWTYRRDLLPGVREARETAVLRRWRRMGVEPLQPDYYNQVAQFVGEVALLRELGGRYVSYPKRLVSWERAIRADLLRRDDIRVFRSWQDDLQPLLADWLSDVRLALAENVDIDPDERLALHLWVRLPSQRSLVLWASSDRAWRDPSTLQPVAIERPTQWVSVEAFCHGTSVVQTLDEPKTSRWNSVRGIPVQLDHPIWSRLPVGVVTIASTLGSGGSALERADQGTLNSIRLYLAANAADLLTP